MKAIGKRENGEIVEFDVVDKTLHCPYNNLSELKLPFV